MPQKVLGAFALDVLHDLEEFGETDKHQVVKLIEQCGTPLDRSLPSLGEPS